MKGVVASTETSAELIAELHTAVDNASVVIQELTSLARKLETRINELEESEARWQEAENRAMSNKGYGDLVCLNVGGQRFTSTESTLRRSPYFTDLLNRGRQIVYIVDQDPKYFGIILNYLRNGVIHQADITAAGHERLVFEFQIYGIPSPNFANNNKPKPAGGLEPINPFYQAVIEGLFSEGGTVLTPHLKKTIVEWLPNKHFKLLYKGTRDGLIAEEFHRTCDNMGPTLTIVQATPGVRIFGGYTAQSWDSNLAPKSDPSAFIFTLCNPHKIPPTRYYPKPGEFRNAISCNSLYGPVFGGNACDLQIFAPSFDSTNACSNFPGSYLDTTGKGKETFAGTARFYAGEVEVYAVS